MLIVLDGSKVFVSTQSLDLAETEVGIVVGVELPSYSLEFIKKVAIVPLASVLESLPPKYSVLYFTESPSLILISIPEIFNPRASVTFKKIYDLSVNMESLDTLIVLKLVPIEYADEPVLMLISIPSFSDIVLFQI